MKGLSVIATSEAELQWLPLARLPWNSRQYTALAPYWNKSSKPASMPFLCSIPKRFSSNLWVFLQHIAWVYFWSFAVLACTFWSFPNPQFPRTCESGYWECWSGSVKTSGWIFFVWDISNIDPVIQLEISISDPEVSQCHLHPYLMINPWQLSKSHCI